MAASGGGTLSLALLLAAACVLSALSLRSRSASSPAYSVCCGWSGAALTMANAERAALALGSIVAEKTRISPIQNSESSNTPAVT